MKPLSEQDEKANSVSAAAEPETGVMVQGSDATPSSPAAPGDIPRDVPLDEARLRQQAIGVKLRQLFDEVVSEPVPDDFLAILRRADERRAGK